MNLRICIQAGTAAVLAASLTAYPAMPGRSAETIPRSTSFIPGYLGNTVRISQAPDVSKQNKIDVGIQAACGDLSLDPQIEAQSANISIDPKMVNRMGASDGGMNFTFDPFTIKDWAKLGKELTPPPVVPPATK